MDYKILKALVKTETDRNHFNMFDKYLNTRGRRIWLVLHIFMSRVTCIALSIQACIYLHSFYIKEEIFVATCVSAADYAVREL